MPEEKNEEQAKGAAKVYTFSRPFDFEGATIAEIILDFDKLIGDDVLAVLRQYKAETRDDLPYMLEADKEYQAYIVAKAAGVHVKLIKAAPAKDFTLLTLRARNFLLL